MLNFFICKYKDYDRIFIFVFRVLSIYNRSGCIILCIKICGHTYININHNHNSYFVYCIYVFK